MWNFAKRVAESKKISTVTENIEIEKQAALENFRSHVQKLKEQELTKQEGGMRDYSPDLVIVDSAELTVDDQMMYEFVAALAEKDPAEFTKEDEMELARWFKAYGQTTSESGNQSRDNFRQYLLNRKVVDLSVAIQKALMKRKK